MAREENPEVDRELIMVKVSKLQQYIKYLERLRESRLKDFIEDFMLSGAAERYLQVSIECMIDIGNEIISSLQLQRPEKYRDIPYILARGKIIPEDFADVMGSMIGFRNLLVHDYASINLELVYKFLQTRLTDFKQFIEYIVRWLEGMKAA